MIINIYTDGAARGNPGNGGYGIVLTSGKFKKEISAGYRYTTNNRMELLAVIVALQQLKNPNMQVNIYTDSKYVCDAIEKKWVFGWKAKGFVGKKNADLWNEFLKIYVQHQVKMNWVKGHAGHPGNERCDVLATEAADNKSNLLIDHVYEQEQKTENGLL
jgi:ribonuclease HI